MLLLQQIWTLQGGMQKNEKGQIATDQEKKNATRAANPTKRKIVGMEPTLPTIRDLNVTLPRKQKRDNPAQLTTANSATEPKN